MNKSIGESRVRTTFNPSNNSIVESFKQKTAEIINDLQALRNEIAAKDYSLEKDAFLEKYSEELFLIEKAQRAYEEAAMWAVKAATT